ncbi:MAG: BREX protein BrxB domain-containing protein [Deltaproteobacteria bacterium]|nr:BREX protein BrxB domain-containing protein [Deltaproteobacteria bacterium]
MTDWKKRLKEDLEPVLHLPDPRPKISAYDNMPYAIFRYPPEDEFAVRVEISLLQTRLELTGKKITRISLAECMAAALAAEEITWEELVQHEKSLGLEKVIVTIHNVLSENQPLDQLVLQRMPPDPDPTRDIVFIIRAGALFPIYRTSTLLEQLMGTIQIPAVLFYPGLLDGAAGLRFMGIMDAEHNYRPKIF